MDNLDRIRQTVQQLGIDRGVKEVLALCDRVAKEDIGVLAEAVGILTEENARLRNELERLKDELRLRFLNVARCPWEDPDGGWRCAGPLGHDGDCRPA